MQLAFSINEICRIVGPSKVAGESSAVVRSIASIEKAVSGDITFLGNARYRPLVATSRASVLLLPMDYVGEPAHDQVFLFVENPSAALAELTRAVEASLFPRPQPGIHPTAIVSRSASVPNSVSVGPYCIIEDGAQIGERCILGPRVHVGRKAEIGNDCWLMTGVVLSNECSLGNRVRLHPGVVVGSDGFGYEFVNGRHEKVPQIGTVTVEDDVEIGANSTLDRARFSRTVVGQGTKIDNLVQIGHNVIIGKHCILCAQVGVSGSTTIEDYVVLAGQVGLAGHITIGKASKVGGQAGVSSDLPPGSYVTGTPPLPLQRDRRVNVIRERLPDMYRRLEALERRLGVDETKSDSST